MTRSLGLRRGFVEVVPHSAAWASLGKAEAESVAALLHDVPVRVEHLGSTAVPGLDAKPILDIAVGVEGVTDLEVLRRRLEEGPYEFRGDKGSEGGLLFVRASGDVRTVHVHVVGVDSPEWGRYIGFRDHLRTHPSDAEMYAERKRDLAARFARDRASYTAAKHDLIGAILERTNRD